MRKITAEKSAQLKQERNNTLDMVKHHQLNGGGLLPRLRFELRRFKKETDAKLKRHAVAQKEELYIRMTQPCSQTS